MRSEEIKSPSPSSNDEPSSSSSPKSDHQTSQEDSSDSDSAFDVEALVDQTLFTRFTSEDDIVPFVRSFEGLMSGSEETPVVGTIYSAGYGDTAVADLERNSRGLTYFNYSIYLIATVVGVLHAFIKLKVLRVYEAVLEKVDLVALGRPNFSHIAWATVGVVAVLAFIMLKDLRLHEVTFETTFASKPFKFVLKLLFRRDAN